ncbi:hypothetical protein TMES_11530 [Thalassospira mesophila]|uniref:Uncharacterized protein n=1 Tax=Thalassospira mesophila TaxID=1293891 RepID=A0A1Y2L016_9PROT|nr:hypothetical protein TMES_11530 [Thalassospira mesophila]
MIRPLVAMKPKLLQFQPPATRQAKANGTIAASDRAGTGKTENVWKNETAPPGKGGAVSEGKQKLTTRKVNRNPACHMSCAKDNLVTGGKVQSVPICGHVGGEIAIKTLHPQFVRLGTACIKAERNAILQGKALKAIIGCLATTRLGNTLRSKWKTDHR